MKRLNKKGFTLIELLAVIIILGILMIIAIPSVTSYIQNSRKSAYVDTSVGYMDAVMKEVNSAKKLKLYSTDTLYMIPVGHEKNKSCVTVESGGQSPFSDEWSYAYVGVTYDGKGYNYYFIGEDGAGQGIGMLKKKTLTDDGTDYIYSAYGETSAVSAAGQNTISKTFAGSLKTQYATTTNAEKTVCNHNGASSTTSCTDTETVKYTSSDEETVLTKYVESVESKQIDTLVYIAAPGCAKTETPQA